MILPYPISANRYWRTFRGVIVRSKEATAYKTAVGWIAKQNGIKLSNNNVQIEIRLHPKSIKDGKASKTRLDLDNCLKVVIDALNGIAYNDDKQVVRIVAEIGEPLKDGGLWVRVTNCEKN